MQQKREILFFCLERNNNNLTTDKSFSKFLFPRKRTYFYNNFREMYDLKGSKKLLSSSENRPIF